MKTYDINRVNELVAQGKLNKQTHPTLPLSIYKYTVETQFGKEWDEITLRARGLVLDDQGVAWSNPIPKFFNLEEHNPSDIPVDLPYEITDKLDGSCVEVFWYQNRLVVCTLGSFTSDQAKAAEHIINRNGWLRHFDSGKTYIFELVSPRNRIVLNYDEEKLVLIAIRDNYLIDDEYELPNDGVFPLVEKINKTYDEVILDKTRPDFTNREGFVIKFANGFRVKVKYEEYFRLHKIMTGVSKHFVWEYLRDGKTKEEVLVNVPDEFFQIVSGWDSDVRTDYNAVELSAKNHFEEIYRPNIDRKTFALEALKRPYPSILFKMLEKKDYSDIVWKIVEPKGEDAIKFKSYKGEIDG